MLRSIFLIILSFLFLSYMLIASGTAMAQDDNLVVHFIDVGQGDSILVQIHDKNMLIDAGDQEHGATVVSFLKSNNVSQIDVLVASNPYIDHIGGMKAVLDNFTVKQVWDTGMSYDDKAYKDFLAMVNQKNIPYMIAERGQSIDLDPSVSIDVLSPPKQRFDSDLKNNSIVLKLTHGNFSFLFMSDAGFDAEKSLLAQSEYPLKSTVLKVADHGSGNSSSLEFLLTVQPRLSIISAGYNNGENHTGAMGRILRTYREGTFTFTSNGTDYWSFDIERPLPCVPPSPPAFTPTPTPSPIPSSKPSPFLSISLITLIFIIVAIYKNYKK